MMSPRPESPETVREEAPMRSASHLISAHPCTTTAAWALRPSPCRPRSRPRSRGRSSGAADLDPHDVVGRVDAQEVPARRSWTLSASLGNLEAATSPSAAAP